jgi:hypothetical protein
MLPGLLSTGSADGGALARDNTDGRRKLIDLMLGATMRAGHALLSTGSAF